MSPLRSSFLGIAGWIGSNLLAQNAMARPHPITLGEVKSFEHLINSAAGNCLANGVLWAHYIETRGTTVEINWNGYQVSGISLFLRADDPAVSYDNARVNFRDGSAAEVVAVGDEIHHLVVLHDRKGRILEARFNFLGREDFCS